MKKVLLLTLVICMLISSVAFAAPSIGHIFSLTENGKVYYYMFGSNDLNAEDVGLTINGKDYNLDENALSNAKLSGKFGIGIADPNDILGDDFIATPYEVVGETRSEGAKTSVVKAGVPDNDVIALNSLTIDGKAVAGFYTGTTETDFYYGLDEITSIESIPEVSYTLSMGEAETSLTEETGGYVYTISASREGRDGETKTAEFKVHFREFTEVTERVYPTYAYQVQLNYIGSVKELPTLTSETNQLLVRSTPDIYSSNTSYLQYITYDVPTVKGYAPVYYDMSNAWLGNKGMTADSDFPVSAYAYDGKIATEELPTVIDESTKGYFKGFKGFNSDSSFLINSFTKSTGSRPTIGSYVMDSTMVKEGTNIVIWKSDDTETLDDKGDPFGYRINYQIDLNGGEGWRMPITVKYVEKNPKDPTDIDTTLSSLTINGNKADAVKDNTYYVAVTDLATNDGITKDSIAVTPTVTGATYEVSEIENNQATITVTAKDGETTDTYTVKFKQPVSGNASISSKTRLAYDGTTYTATGRNQAYVHANMPTSPLKTSGNHIEYVDFDFSLDNIAVVGNMTIAGNLDRISGCAFYSTSVEKVTSSCTFDEFLDGGSANCLGTFTYDKNKENPFSVSITFDSKDVKIRNNKNVMIVLIDTTVDSAAYLNDPSLTFNYITLD